MRTIQISDVAYEFLKDLQHELNTQTNDGNADPVYWGVRETHLEPAPEGCGDAFIYMGDGVTMTTEEAVQYVEENIRDDEELQEQWKNIDKNWMDEVADFLHDEMGENECRVIWQEEKSFISQETGAFITKRACKEYIEKCHYNHSNPHTYAMTAYRNYELGQLLKILKTMVLVDGQQLQSEELSANEDLEKEMQHYFCTEWAGDPIALARHFAEWQKHHTIEKSCYYIRANMAILDVNNNDCMPEWLDKYKIAMEEQI